MDKVLGEGRIKKKAPGAGPGPRREAEGGGKEVS